MLVIDESENMKKYYWDTLEDLALYKNKQDNDLSFEHVKTNKGADLLHLRKQFLDVTD